MILDGFNYYGGNFHTERLPKGTELATTFKNIEPLHWRSNW